MIILRFFWILKCFNYWFCQLLMLLIFIFQTAIIAKLRFPDMYFFKRIMHNFGIKGLRPSQPGSQQFVSFCSWPTSASALSTRVAKQFLRLPLLTRKVSFTTFSGSAFWSANYTRRFEDVELAICHVRINAKPALETRSVSFLIVQKHAPRRCIRMLPCSLHVPHHSFPHCSVALWFEAWAFISVCSRSSHWADATHSACI